jgi:hypothetical protein
LILYSLIINLNAYISVSKSIAEAAVITWSSANKIIVSRLLLPVCIRIARILFFFILSA